MLQRILREAQAYLDENSLKKITAAFEFAQKAHEGQLRLSGDPYIAHPTEVALTLIQIRQSAETICAALLHDVVEDTSFSVANIKKEFGEEVAFLVRGVTKLESIKLQSKEEVQIENIRKMFLAMAKDVRIVFIKLADRLHNMRTLDSLCSEKQKEISSETMDIYAPLAHRLGLGIIKWELEDLAFRYLEPQIYGEIKEKIALKRRERQEYLEKFKKETERIMKSSALKGDVTVRPKHFYSIYDKMRTQQLSFEEIYDLLAVRILLNSEADCYAMLGQIHSRWKPIQGKIKDYIAMPKPNMYQSLHTTVIGPEGRPVEIQIRTFDMHNVAEYGIASHWLYKETDKFSESAKKEKNKSKEYLHKITWLRKLTEQAYESKDFLASLKTELMFGEVFVFSPKGDVYALPEGATTLDFAYEVHTDVGHRCSGAKVNGRIVPLEQELKNGDIVEILTKKELKPSSDWLAFVKSPRARDKIKAWIYKQRKQDHLIAGRENLERELKAFLLEPKEIQKKYFDQLLKKYSLLQEEDLYVAIGKGDLAAKAVARVCYNFFKEDHAATATNEEIEKQVREAAPVRKKKKNDPGVSVAGVDTIMIKLAHCCYPLPGDNIVGFVTKGYGITVHRENCPNVKGSAENNEEERKIEVFWQEPSGKKYPAELEVLGFDRVGLLKDILNIVAEKETNVLEARASKKGNSEIKAAIVLEITDLEKLRAVMNALKGVKDVYDVYRRNGQ